MACQIHGEQRGTKRDKTRSRCGVATPKTKEHAKTTPLGPKTTTKSSLTDSGAEDSMMAKFREVEDWLPRIRFNSRTCCGSERSHYCTELVDEEKMH